jgi:putative addiction module component (TIGR02574 family)
MDRRCAMSTTFEVLEKQARALSPEEKAALAHILTQELDAAADPDAERLWLDEAERRYDAYATGELAALPGDDVMKRARARLK